MQQKIEQDLKSALLSGDKGRAETLRGLKSAILNEAINLGARETGLSDEQIQKVLAKESKKRQEAADLYQKGGSAERAEAELAEKSIIDSYLPAQLGKAELEKLVEEEVAKVPGASMQHMGQIIGAVRGKAGPTADGGLIAKLVKERLG